jgi:hypothetical protein
MIEMHAKFRRASMQMKAVDVTGSRYCRQPANSIWVNPATNRAAEVKRPCRVPATQCKDSVGETIATDQHYTPAELGKVWHCSPNTIRRLFEDEAGVLTYTAAAPSRSPRRRRMVQMRIPARVAIRVHARLSNS